MATPTSFAVGPTERRSSPRYSMVGDAVITRNGFEPRTGQVQNLSMTGCCLELPEPALDLGSDLHLRFTVNGTQFELRGVVANLQHGNRIGVQFAPTHS